MRWWVVLAGAVAALGVVVAAVGLSVALRPGETSDAQKGARPPVAFTIAFTDVSDPGASEPTTGVYTVGADGSNRKLVVDYASSPAWSPDGRRIAVGGQDMIKVYRGAGNDPYGADLTQGLCDKPSWSPNGRKIACIGPEDSLTYDAPPGLWVIDTRTGSEQRLAVNIPLGDWGEFPDAPSWSPDGTRLALADITSAIRIVDVKTGGTRALATGTAPDWSPNGDQIAYASGNAIIVSAADGRKRHTVVTSDQSLDQPSWSPDAKHIVYAPFKDVYRADEGWTQRVGLGLRIVDADGANDRPITSSGLDPDCKPR